MRQVHALFLASSLACVPLWSAAAADVYRCTSDGGTTFSDRPCDTAAKPYEVDVSRVSTYEAPAQRVPSSAAAPAPRASRARAADAAAAAQAKREATCERVIAGLKDVRDRQRSGYTAKEGERLKARRARLEAQRRELRCR